MPQKPPEDMTRYELKAEIVATETIIENTVMLTVATLTADYLQELYDELASRPRQRKFVGGPPHSYAQTGVLAPKCWSA